MREWFCKNAIRSEADLRALITWSERHEIELLDLSNTERVSDQAKVDVSESYEW